MPKSTLTTTRHGRDRDQQSALHLERKTVRRYARATTADKLLAQTPTRAATSTPTPPAWPSTGKKAVVNAVRLTADIRARGYRGSEHLVRRHLQTWRTSSTAPSPTPICPPHLGKVTTWMMRPSDELTTEEHARLRHILDRCPTLPPANELVRDFAGMVRERRSHHLNTWVVVMGILVMRIGSEYSESMGQDGTGDTIRR